MDNEYGTVDSYIGNYYTVKTYINSILVSTEYYSGSFNGIGSIESTGKQYFGLLTIYASASSRSENTGSSEDYLLFAINFDDSSTEAQVGTAECTDITLDNGSDGTTAAVLNGTSSYISATQDDGTPLLRGTDTATISMRAKLEQPSTTNGWYFYTAWNDSAQSGGSRSYIGMYSDGTDGSLVAERYRDNSGTPTITADTGFDTWYDITYIIDGYLAEVYVDGEFVGSVDYESSGSDHIMSTILGSGDNIVTYFGRANWGSGEYAKGMFDDIAVYSFAPAIDLGDLTSVKSDIELPTAAESSDGYTIEWESSDETVIASDGTVTRPTDGDKIVTLTATITFGDKTLTREFEVTVKEISNGVYIKSLEPDGSAISYELEVGDAFDSEKYDVYIAVYNEEGALNAVVKNQMSGTIETNSSANERIKVMVWEKDTMNPVVDAIEASVVETSVYKLMSYTTDGGEYYGSWSSATAPIIGNSLHLAVSSDGGETYTPLNYNTGVLYAEADYSAEGGNPYKGVGKMLRDPYVFRTATGYGVIAARADETSDTDSTDGSVMIYTSEDLTDFEFAGYLMLDTAAVYEPACVYENGKYTVSWSTSDGGTRKYAVTEDFKSIGGEGASDEVYENPSIDIDHSVEATNVIGITAAEYKTLTTKLNAPINTGVEEFEDVTVSAGANAVLPETATAIYNDGSTQKFPVTWDTSSLDTSVAGKYTLTGTVTAKDYDSSLIANRADPCVLYANGKYYFTATRDNGSQYVLNLRVADTIEGLADAEDILLYDAGSELIWAPEIHEVDGTMMIFFAWGATWDKVQSHVIVLEGDDAETADDWSEPQRIMLADGETNLIDNGITLDMTCFEWDGTYYLAWAQRQVSSSGDYNYSTYGYESSNIYIAKYNPANPAQLASGPVVISRPSYGWERTIAEVDEGPFVIENDGRLYMTVAANSTNCSYAIKLLTLNEGGDPTNPDDWSIKGYPLLSTAMNDSEPGPGHSSFTIDENGDPVLVYHWGSRGSNRTTTVKKVHFNTNGEPVLNIQRGEQLSDEFKTVTIKVTVK
ncbi:MAG: family 43 glycosylhydrolase [Firmicutes bacterium]|nr:family 43 glycosylhydrolase [Bacillota bacterium]